MLVLLIIDYFWHDAFIGFLEHYVSPDGTIESAGTFEFYFLVYARFLLVWGMGALLLCFSYEKLQVVFNSIKSDIVMMISYIVSCVLLGLWLLLGSGKYQGIYVEGWAE